MITLAVDASQLADLKKVYQLFPSNAAKVIVRALNRAGNSAASATQRAIAEKLSVNYGAIKNNLRRTKATKTNMEYRLTGTGKGIALKYMHPHQNKRGVVVGGQLIPHAFISQALGGNVFVRAQGASAFSVRARAIALGRKRIRAAIKWSEQSGLVWRLPIIKLTGPSVPQAMLDGDIENVFKSKAKEVFNARLTHEAQYLLHKEMQAFIAGD